MKDVIVIAGLAAWLLSAPTSFAAVPVSAEAPVPDPEMKWIYDADQADRSGDMTKIDWAVVAPRDAERRQQTRVLLSEGRLHTGEDFFEAAYVFQHGEGDDYLLAHTLAIIATKKGDPGGPSIAAKTLDRYLVNIGRKQIYGTQTFINAAGVTKEPYDSDLVSDALRRELGVEDLAGQDLELEQIKARHNSYDSGGNSVQRSGNLVIKCETGPISRIFGHTTWQVYSCDNGGLQMVGSTPSKAMILASVLGRHVIATSVGGSGEAEVNVAIAALQAMTPSQIADVVAQTKQAVKH